MFGRAGTEGVHNDDDNDARERGRGGEVEQWTCAPQIH